MKSLPLQQSQGLGTGIVSIIPRWELSANTAIAFNSSVFNRGLRFYRFMSKFFLHWGHAFLSSVYGISMDVVFSVLSKYWVCLPSCRPFPSTINQLQKSVPLVCISNAFLVTSTRTILTGSHLDAFFQYSAQNHYWQKSSVNTSSILLKPCDFASTLLQQLFKTVH